MRPELKLRAAPAAARPFMGRIQEADGRSRHPLGAGPTTHENCSPHPSRPALGLKARTLVETTTMLTKIALVLESFSKASFFLLTKRKYYYVKAIIRFYTDERRRATLVRAYFSRLKLQRLGFYRSPNGLGSRQQWSVSKTKQLKMRKCLRLKES